MAKKDYGRTQSGEPITDELVEKLAAQAEAGFDVDEIIRRRGGRPPMGSSAASVESVRLDPELSAALRERAGAGRAHQLRSHPRMPSSPFLRAS